MEIKLLKRVPLFSQLDDDDLEKIRALCVTQHYVKDRIILIEEEAGNTLFLIQKGRVKVSRISDDGREVILSILEPGDFFGEMSYLTQTPRTANVLADAETIVIEVNERMLENLDAEIREKIKDNIIGKLIERLKDMNNLFISLSC